MLVGVIGMRGADAEPAFSAILGLRIGSILLLCRTVWLCQQSGHFLSLLLFLRGAGAELNVSRVHPWPRQIPATSSSERLFMKWITAIALALGAFSVSAQAAPVKLSKDKLDSITAGAITQTNNGGNTPGGNANGIPATNPAGKAPAGQNK
jgi:hypothetical protein